MSNNPKIVAVIPARMGSSRFPGKPLAQILGIPMIEHVYKRTAMSTILHQVYIATCDQEIYDAAINFGGAAIMTSDRHTRASDRVAEAAHHFDADIIVMVQGDEPMTVPEMIDQAVEPMLADPEVGCVNLAGKIQDEAEHCNPATIKVVVDKNWDALYFSRVPIPTASVMGFDNIPLYKQVCIIPFRREMLLKYSHLEPTPLEIAESVDMMRFLEHGYKVRMVPTNCDTHAVDTPEDLKYVESLLRSDSLVSQYLK